MREIAKRPYNPDVENGVFTFINSQWESWEGNYFNTHKVGWFGLWPDGLMAALHGLTFRALANGKLKSNGEPEVSKLAIYVHDVFNFEPPESLLIPDFLGF